MNLYTVISKSDSAWVKENVKVSVLYEGIAKVEFSERDRHGDKREVYLFNRKDGTSYLTDDGLTLQELEGAGLSAEEGSSTLSAVKSAADTYGVELTEDQELLVECSEEYFAEKAKALLQCIGEVSGLACQAEK